MGNNYFCLFLPPVAGCILAADCVIKLCVVVASGQTGHRTGRRLGNTLKIVNNTRHGCINIYRYQLHKRLSLILIKYRYYLEIHYLDIILIEVRGYQYVHVISPCRGGVGAGLTGSWGGGGECGAMFSPWLRHEVTVPGHPG